MEFKTKSEKRAYLAGLGAQGDGDYQIAPGIYGSGAYRERIGRSKKLYGKGAYRPYKYFRKGLIKDIGESVGDMFGQKKLGGLLGEGTHSVMNAIGIGDYKVSHNTLMESGGNDPPKINSVGEGGMRVRHREYLQNIVTASTSAFNLQSFPLNPGLVNVFPWLAQVAAGFEQYRINGMIWEFKSTSADALNSTNTALGSVIMATEYDASRPVFINQQQMANHEFASSGRQSQSILHAIECKKSLSPVSELWVRTGAIPTGDDERLYDFGLFQIATVGQQGASVTIGELWVSYDITFYKPQLISGLGLELATDHFYNSTGVSTAAYFGTGAGLTAKSGSNLGCVLGATTITFPPGLSEGSYLVVYTVTGGSVTLTQPTFGLTNATGLIIWSNDANAYTSDTGAAWTVLTMVYTLTITGQGAKITLSGGNLPTTITQMDLLITQINGGIVT